MLLSDLDREKLTKKKIRAVIVKVARWKSLAEVLQTRHNLEKMEAMENNLQQLILGLGASLKMSGSPRNKSSKQAILKQTKEANLLPLSHLLGTSRGIEVLGS